MKILALKSPLSFKARRFFCSSIFLQESKKTALYDLHLAYDAKMVDFGGWNMPLIYNRSHSRDRPGGLSIAESVHHTRTYASLFDVSHMLQVNIKGSNRKDFMERVTVADINEIDSSNNATNKIPTKGLALNNASLSLMLSESGGILDDCIITNLSDSIYMVSNAGCAEQDWNWLNKWCKHYKNEGMDIELERLSDFSLLALQGPKAVNALEKIVHDSADSTDFKTFGFMTCRRLRLKNDIECLVSRLGYTGEDGFEIQVHSSKAPELASLILENDASVPVEWAGLGARDILRLEAGLCLYGHDLDSHTTPIEGTLLWTIGKRQRKLGTFIGSDKVLKQIEGTLPVEKKRVGIIMKPEVQSAPAREGYEIYSTGENPEKLGVVTSGCPSPCLNENIAMGYVKLGHHKAGTEVNIKVRKKFVKALVSKMPFVPNRYYKV